MRGDRPTRFQEFGYPGGGHSRDRRGGMPPEYARRRKWEWRRWMRRRGKRELRDVEQE